VYVFVCVCVRERESEREKERVILGTQREDFFACFSLLASFSLAAQHTWPVNHLGHVRGRRARLGGLSGSILSI
jgi:hypothetical protein